MEAIPLPVGHAAHIHIRPPQGATHWRICRGSMPPTDENDGTIYEGSDSDFLDLTAQNNVPYHYAAFFRADDAAWGRVQRATITVTPDYQSIGPDAQLLLSQRLRDGLTVEVAANRLVASRRGDIEVLTAPPLIDSTQFPCVSVHLDSDAPAERTIGEDLFSINDDDEWTEGEGWLSRIELTIMGWCLGPADRIAIRQAIKRLVVANFPVFSLAGLMSVEFSQHDEENFQEYAAPLYMSRGRFTCLVPYAVTRRFGEIADIEVNALPIE